MKFYTKLILNLACLGALYATNVNAQEFEYYQNNVSKQTENEGAIATDTIGEPDEFRYSFDYGSFFDGKFTFSRAILSAHDIPRIDVKFSKVSPAIYEKRFGGEFSETGSISVSAGYFSEKSARESNLTMFDNYYLRYENYSSKLGVKRDYDKIGLEAWKLAWGYQEGFGWQSGDVGISLYNANNLNWTTISSFDKTQNLSEQDIALLESFASGTRFGRSFSAGAEIRFWNTLGVSCAYEQEQIFERHKFWYWTVSEIIESAATGVVSSFIDDIAGRSKVAGPIINFIVQNGISYGFYELRKKKMNWPFETAAPIYMDKFTLGVSLTF
ncbi:MAG: hypothetical protein PHV24_08425 [Candidatus Kapabacteria bacterium]|nr:hypothetical protein [Candidatus Kapabacteria bacterium]